MYLVKGFESVKSARTWLLTVQSRFPHASAKAKAKYSIVQHGIRCMQSAFRHSSVKKLSSSKGCEPSSDMSKMHLLSSQMPEEFSTQAFPGSQIFLCSCFLIDAITLALTSKNASQFSKKEE